MPTDIRSDLRTGPLSAETRDAIMALVKEHGPARAASMLGVGKDTVARAVAGFNVRPSVALAIASRLPSAP